MLKKFLKDYLIYINTFLIIVLFVFGISIFVKVSKLDRIDNFGNKVIYENSGDFFAELQEKIYKNIFSTSTYVVGITSSKNVKFYMEDPTLLQGPGTAIEKNSKLDEASGIFISKDGYILTNKHVVENTDAKYAVVFRDGSIYDVDKIWTDKQLDLAVLKINIKEKELDAKRITLPKFLDVDQGVRLGTLFLALGKKGENDNMVGLGILSSKNRQIKINNENLYVNMYQINSVLQPGFSGSPLVDLDGNVVAINTAINQGDGESFALPISDQLISSTIKSIEKYGSVIRGLVGIKYDEISNNIGLQQKYNMTGGILISDVLPDLPAFKAGLQMNDIIVAINGKLIDINQPFLFQIYNYLPGDELKLQVLRNLSLIEMSLILGENN